MESELQCPVCLRQFSQPVLLPCSHPACLNCARSLAKSSDDDLEKMSEYSEADSGVACSSRPGSCLGSPADTPSLLTSVTCVTCGLTSPLGERGLDSLQPCLLLERLLPRFGRASDPVTCQLCEKNARPAAVLCQQCQVYYCTQCQQRCHPARGPLATHSLLRAGAAPARPSPPDPRRCWRHPAVDCDRFCVDCDEVTCVECRRAGAHDGHSLPELTEAVKGQKTALSRTLQSLSERAKTATEVIHRLRKAPETVTESCAALEAAITDQCDALAAALLARRQRLLAHVQQERQRRSSAAKEQVTSWTGQIQRTTSLLRFCIETLKEPNSVAFLQMGAKLQGRAASVLQSLEEELRALSEQEPVPALDLTLDTSAVEAALKRLSFTQMKPPAAPAIVHGECCLGEQQRGDSLAPDGASFVEGHVLELDDGNGGEFAEVYCGPQTVCTIDGLHFNSVYQARVRSFNGTGPGPYSPPVRLQTVPGADELGWSMYIDDQRSWFMHGGRHEVRVEGGVGTGSVVGVLLDLRRGQLSFFVDGQPQGPIAFTGLSGTFFPAVSLNRSCKVKLRTSLEPPSDSSGTDSDHS